MGGAGNKVNSTAQFYNERLRDFLVAYQEDYPEYQSYTNKDGIKRYSTSAIIDRVEMLEKNVVKQTEVVFVNSETGEIIESDNKIGYTLRFPRLVKIRNDKCYKDCMDINDVIEMSEINKKMIKKSNIKDSMEEES